MIESRDSEAKLSAENIKLRSQLEQTSQQLAKQAMINKSVISQLEDTKRLADEHFYERTTLLDKFLEIKTKCDKLEEKEQIDQQHLEEHRKKAHLTDARIENLLKYISSLNHEVAEKKHLEVALDNTKQVK